MMSIWRLLPQSCSHSTVGKAHYKWTVRSIETEKHRWSKYCEWKITAVCSSCRWNPQLGDFTLPLGRLRQGNGLKGGQRRGVIGVAGTCCSGKTCVVYTEAISSRDKITWNEGFRTRASFVKVNWCVGDCITQLFIHAYTTNRKKIYIYKWSLILPLSCGHAIWCSQIPTSIHKRVRWIFRQFVGCGKGVAAWDRTTVALVGIFMAPRWVR